LQIDVAKSLCEDYPIKYKIARKVELEAMLKEELDDDN
jgi:hypothetical protein